MLMMGGDKYSLSHCPVSPGVSTSAPLPPDPFALCYLYYVFIISVEPRCTRAILQNATSEWCLRNMYYKKKKDDL